MVKKVTAALPEVNFSEEGTVRHLHLGSPWIQGSMRVNDPTALVHEYIQRMMAWLIFVDPDTVADPACAHAAWTGCRFADQVLLQGAAHVANRCCGAESQVLQACRGWFKLPTDNARIQVVLADAGEEIRKPEWQGVIDALQIDLYDEEAAAPVLDSADFYADCRRLLTDEGALTVNLFGHTSSFERQRAAPFGSLWCRCGLGL